MMAEAAVKDSSMEDILASIRRIINADNKAEESAKQQGGSATSPSAASSASLPPASSSEEAVPQTRTEQREAPSNGQLGADSGAAAGETAPRTGPESIASAVHTPVPAAPGVKSPAAELASVAEKPAVVAPQAKPEAAPAQAPASRFSLAELARELREKSTPSPVKAQAPAALEPVAAPEAPVADPVVELAGASAEDIETADMPEMPETGTADDFIDPVLEAADLLEEISLEDDFREELGGASVARDAEPVLVAVETAETGPAESSPASYSAQPVQSDNTASAGDGAVPAASPTALVAPATENAVNSSIQRLRESIEGNEAARVEAVLRPMLKEWLDANLPDLVEKVVREEISRLVR